MSEQPSPLGKIGIEGKPVVPPGDHDPRFDYRSGTRECDRDNRQSPSEHGRVLGAALAKIVDEQAELHPEMPGRCKSCAFRAGTVPNQMAGTLVEALNCVLGADPNPFGCHQRLDAGGIPTHYCIGYVLARRAPLESVMNALQDTVTTLQGMSDSGPAV